MFSVTQDLLTNDKEQCTAPMGKKIVTYPLLQLPNEPCQIPHNQQHTLSNLFPGVDHLLKHLQPAMTFGNVLPSLNKDNETTAVDTTVATVPFPLILPPLDVGPSIPSKYKNDHGHATVNTDSPCLINPDRELPSVQLPDVPVRPFIPQLIFPQQHDVDNRACVLLAVNDRVSQMKHKGFGLLVDNQNNRCTCKASRKQRVKKQKKGQPYKRSSVQPTCTHTSTGIDSSSSLSPSSHISSKGKAITTSEPVVQQPLLEQATVSIQVDLLLEPPDSSVQGLVMPTTTSVEVQTDRIQDLENNSIEEEIIINNDIVKDEIESHQHVDGKSNVLKEEPNRHPPHCYVSVSDVDGESDDTLVGSPTPPLKEASAHALQNIDQNVMPLEHTNPSFENESPSMAGISLPTPTQYEGFDDTLQQLKNLELQILLLEHAANDVEKDIAASHKVI